MNRSTHANLSQQILIVCCGIIVACSGCNSKEPKQEDKATNTQQSAADRIAVIDLNVVAQEIGAREKIVEALKQRESSLISQLNELKDQLGNQLNEIKADFGDDLNQQQQEQLDEILLTNQQKISLQSQAAQSQLVSHQAQLKMQLLNQVRPVAYQVAQELGMSLVLTTSQVYAAGPNVNITQAVVKKIKALNSEDNLIGNSSAGPQQRVAELPGGGDFLPQ